MGSICSAYRGNLAPPIAMTTWGAKPLRRSKPTEARDLDILRQEIWAKPAELPIFVTLQPNEEIPFLFRGSFYGVSATKAAF